MKLSGSHILFLIAGLVAGFMLCEGFHRTNQAQPPAAKVSDAAPVTLPAEPEQPAAPESEIVTVKQDVPSPATKKTPEAMAKTSPVNAKLWVESNILDLGIVPNDKNTVREVYVHNKGTDPLHINKVKAQCGCTSATMKARTIPPGEQAALTITVNPKKIKTAKSKKKVTLFTNDPDAKEYRITVSAEIIPEYVIEPAHLNFGNVQKGETPELTFTVRQNGDEPIEVTQVKSMRVDSLFDLSMEKVPEAEWAKPQRPEYRITAKLSPYAAPRAHSVPILIQTNCKRMPRSHPTVRVNVTAPYSVSPASVVLQNHVPKGVKPPPQIRVVAKTGTPAIANVQVSSEYVVATPRAGDKPNVAVIALELSPDAPPGNRNETVSFKVALGGKTYGNRLPLRVIARKKAQGTKSPAGRTPAGMVNRRRATRLPAKKPPAAAPQQTPASNSTTQ